MVNCNNITKIVKLILLDSSLYGWYIETLNNNVFYKSFIERYNGDYKDILRD